MTEPKQLDPVPVMSDADADAYRTDFVRHLSQTAPGIKDTVIVDAAGCSLKTADGRILLDMISGIAVSNVGHCHPVVVEAIKSQVDRFAHVDVYGRFTLPPQVEIARRLASVTPRQPGCRLPDQHRDRSHRRRPEAGPQIHRTARLRRFRAILPRPDLRCALCHLEGSVA